jgi:putative membrane protein
VLAAAAVAALLATPLLAQTGAAPQKLSSGAQSFVTKAANGNMFEVETSKVAVDKATRDDVKSFAQKMIADHGKANSELQTVANKIGAKIPMKMDAGHQAKADRLNRASAAQFDQAYINAQAAAHQEAISLLGRYAKSGTNPDLKTFASNTLPIVEGHARELSALDQGSAAIGASQGTTGTTGGTGETK